MRTPVPVGVVGFGDRGLSLARTFDRLPGSELRWICDRSPEVRMAYQSGFASAKWTASVDDLLSDDGVDGIVIATPSSSHFELALRALDADKHVFVEQPLALTGGEAQKLVEQAALRDRVLMVGNSLLFHPAVRKLKDLVATGALGDLYYLYGNRQDLGEVRPDENVLWNLGAPDVALVLHLLGDQPIEVAARGESYLRRGVPDVVFCYLKFATGISAHLHLSWLDPHKLRRTTVVGSERMAVVDDLEPERKLTIYDKRAVSEPAESGGGHVDVQLGDIVSPRLTSDDPLRLECEQFVSRIRSHVGVGSNGREGATIVEILETLQRSLDCGGLPQAFVGNSRIIPDRGVIPLIASRDVS